MKWRIAMWGIVGFFVASCWVLYTFVASSDSVAYAMRQPAVEAVAFISCPIIYAGRYFPLHFWWVPPINAATYAAVGLIAELLRRKSTPSLAV